MRITARPGTRFCRKGCVGSVHPYTRISMIVHRLVIRLEVTSVKALDQFRRGQIADSVR